MLRKGAWNNKRKEYLTFAAVQSDIEKKNMRERDIVKVSAEVGGGGYPQRRRQQKTQCVLLVLYPPSPRVCL